jgi:cytochrome b
MVRKANQIKVWDPFVRLFHGTLMGTYLISWITEDEWIALHANVGYVITGLLLLRIIWGFVGTGYARFSHFVTSPSQVLRYLQDLLFFRAKRTIGHNPAGGATIVTLLVTLLITALAGMLAYGVQGLGPLTEALFSNTSYGNKRFEEAHEFFANLTLLLVVIHLAGVVFGSLLHRESLVLSMITGKKRG